MPPKEFNQKLAIGDTKIKVAVADELSEQINGLAGLQKLCDNCGMLFVFAKPKIQNFWMKGMKFPLDFVFIRDGTVTEVAENIPVKDASGSISAIRSREPADKVLEVGAGFISRHKISIGDSIK